MAWMYIHTDKQAYQQLPQQINGEIDGHACEHKHTDINTDRYTLR